MADHLAHWVARAFPGLDLGTEARRALLDVVAELVESQGAFLAFRDELPVGEPLEQALMDGLGAEPGDEVIEVRPPALNGEAPRRWPVGTRLAA
jgi:hypothetical protein